MPKTERKHIPNPHGRPIKNIIEPIDDTPENIASAIMLGKAKENWNYLENEKLGENSI